MDLNTIRDLLQKLSQRDDDPQVGLQVREVYDTYLKDCLTSNKVPDEDIVNEIMDFFHIESPEEVMREARILLQARRFELPEYVVSSVVEDAVIPQDRVSVDLRTGAVTDGADGKWDPNTNTYEGHEPGLMVIRVNKVMARNAEGRPTKVDTTPVFQITEDELDDLDLMPDPFRVAEYVVQSVVGLG